MKRFAVSTSGIPDRGGDIPLGAGLLVPEIIDRHYAAIGALDAAGVAEVAAAAVVTQDNRLAPAMSRVTADACEHPVGFCADSVGETKPAVSEAQQMRRISLARVGSGLIDERP